MLWFLGHIVAKMHVGKVDSFIMQQLTRFLHPTLIQSLRHNVKVLWVVDKVLQCGC